MVDVFEALDLVAVGIDSTGWDRCLGQWILRNAGQLPWSSSKLMRWFKGNLTGFWKFIQGWRG